MRTINLSDCKTMPTFKAHLRAKVRTLDKTQTRRLKGLEGVNQAPSSWKLNRCDEGKAYLLSHDNLVRVVAKSQYKPGDVVYLREPLERKGKHGTFYRDDLAEAPIDWPWKRDTLPQIHMPKHLARCFYEITSVRVERVWDISAQDILAEGIERENGDLRGDWARIWIAINGQESWDANDWVFAYEWKAFEGEVRHG